MGNKCFLGNSLVAYWLGLSAFTAGAPGLIPGLGTKGFPCGSVKHLPAMWETWVRSLGWEDSPGEGKGYPFQYSGLENSTDCIVHGVTKSWIGLSDFDFHWELRYQHTAKKNVCSPNVAHVFHCC